MVRGLVVGRWKEQTAVLLVRSIYDAFIRFTILVRDNDVTRLM